MQHPTPSPLAPAAKLNNYAELEWAGERLLLFPQRAMFWQRARTLIITDTHFGKDATFRSVGVPLPHGAAQTNLLRLSSLLATTDAARLIVLGDFFHSRYGRFDQTMAAIEQWRAEWPNVEIINIRGNHDIRAGDPPSEWGIDVVQGPASEPPFVWAHEPISIGGMYVVAGHIHPGVSLRGGGNSSLTSACFWFGENVAVLPAFGEFTGLAMVRPQRGDQVYVVNGDEIAQVRVGR